MIRLFGGLEIPTLIKSELSLLRGGLEHARWQRDDQLHVTLRFIGEVDRKCAHDVALALEGVSVSPFMLSLQGIGHFDTKGKTRALWAGVSERRALEHLHDKIDRALIGAGLPPENRRYTPHLTLARFAPRRVPQLDAWKAANMGFWSTPFEVAGFSLFQSHRSDEGSCYEVLERYGVVHEGLDLVAASSAVEATYQGAFASY